MFGPSLIVRSRTLVRLATALLICVDIANTIAQESTHSRQTTRPQPVSYLVLGSDIRDQIDAVIQNWLLVAPEHNPQMLQMYRQRDTQPYQNLLPWSGEFAGKYLTSCVEVLRITDNVHLREHTAQFVGDLIACQDSDGYIGPFPRENRLTGWAPNTMGTGGDTWDAWGHYHVMLGLLSWHKFANDEAALNSASKIADLLGQQFSGPERTILSTRSPEMNQAVIHSLALLYEATSQDRYLNLAKEIVDEFAMPGAGDYFRSGRDGVDFYKTPKPRWESLHPILGLAELYWITGNEEYRTAVENLWWSIARLDRHNNGGFSSGEQAQGGPYHQGPIETCCTIAWMALSTAMLQLSDNPVVADELELSLFNQVQALHGADGSWCTYNTPMDGIRLNSTKDISFQIRPGSEQLNCCSVNAARGFGLSSDWAVLTNDKTLTINYYGDCEFQTRLNGTDIKVEQITKYPLDNAVKLQFALERSTPMKCRLRIPHWSTNTAVKLNGKNVAATAGQYVVIDRSWNTGDTIELNFDFGLRLLSGENACSGKVSIYRGPLLLALDTPSSAAPLFSHQFQKHGNLQAANQSGAFVEYSFVGERVTWNGFRYDDAGTANVFIDGKQIATVDQYDPQRDTPFQWTYDQCGPGPHTLRIEVTSEKQDASKGTFINVVDLEPKQQPQKITIDDLLNAKFKPRESSFTLDIATNDGAMISLVPYRDAGKSEASYITWLTMDNFPPIPFTRENPSRTFRLPLH